MVQRPEEVLMEVSSERVRNKINPYMCDYTMVRVVVAVDFCGH